MKKVFVKIQAIFLVLTILLASNSYAISSHFCGETLVAVSYIGDDLECGMEEPEDDCDGETSVKKDCCSDILTIIEAEELNATVDFSTNKQLISFVAVFIESYINLFQKSIFVEKELFKDFSPPDIEENIQILHQTFLI